MPIGKVWIYRLLFVILCVFVPLRISPPRIKLAASNFARRFINVQGRESHIFGNFVSPEVQNRTNWPARRPRPPACKHYRSEMRRRKRHARDAPFVKSRIMCGYTSVPKDRRNCLHESLLEVLNVLKTWQLNWRIEHVCKYTQQAIHRFTNIKRNTRCNADLLIKIS